jgi:hypothetical protein
MGDVNCEKGGARLSTIVSLALFAVFAVAMFNVLPVYIADYSLNDEMIQIARRPNIGNEPEKETIDRVMDEVIDLELDEYINPSQIKVTKRAATRQIRLSYSREVTILPNWTRTFSFDHDVNERIF